jgi:SAM-dependent methyltransferase
MRLTTFGRCLIGAAIAMILVPYVAAGPASEDARQPEAQSNEAGEQPEHGHDSGSIDCPLRAQGVDTHGMRPFEEVEEYIAFLERADRAEWQRPGEVVAALGLTGSEIVADVGAGSGYFTFRLAAALPEGRVRAIDIEPEMLRHIHHKATSAGVNNVDVVVATPDDPRIDGTEDILFVCDVLHHVQDRERWLGRLFDETKPGASLVLIEFREGALPEGPPESMKIPRDAMVELVRSAGFELADDRSELLPYQTFLVFRRP